MMSGKKGWRRQKEAFTKRNRGPKKTKLWLDILILEKRSDVVSYYGIANHKLHLVSQLIQNQADDLPLAKSLTQKTTIARVV
jgi:hypothetical protein